MCSSDLVMKTALRFSATLRRSLWFAIFLAASAACGRAAEAVAASVNAPIFGRNSYVEYQPGELPIVITAPHGGREKPEEIADRVNGVISTDTNTLELAWRLDARTGRLLVMSAEDNIVKGASGQAVQSFNVLCGYPETAGLL